ncbi:hypothetical protein [Burkholderia lata]|uniref:Uncharacterized protein n=1 Tax=Burkholderia lata (strain ATCC 17760 / DSM 23089 / LMG 22485 / NCIMB 9086 / R18194 / 383) TaxID=482957 RepID=A0A6P2HN98_BURL3|nr:hypothetical protein [Burkholderia lata]VWB18370.1 hypothetical protein BLA6863_00696 [Burkholderia lata]
MDCWQIADKELRANVAKFKAAPGPGSAFEAQGSRVKILAELGDAERQLLSQLKRVVPNDQLQEVSCATAGKLTNGSVGVFDLMKGKLDGVLAVGFEGAWITSRLDLRNH